MHAAWSGHEDCIRILLDAGADATMKATMKDKVRCACVPPPTITTRRCAQEGKTALDYAREYNFADCVAVFEVTVLHLFVFPLLQLWSFRVFLLLSCLLLLRPCGPPILSCLRCCRILLDTP